MHTSMQRIMPLKWRIGGAAGREVSLLEINSYRHENL